MLLLGDGNPKVLQWQGDGSVMAGHWLALCDVPPTHGDPPGYPAACLPNAEHVQTLKSVQSVVVYA